MKRAETLWQSFGFAFAGLTYAFATQRNLRIHTVVALLVLGSAWILGLAVWKAVALVLAILVVMVAELINTAVEAAVDLASPGFHPLAKVAKDVAAAAVLLAAAGAAAVGLWLLGPALASFPARLMVRLRESLWVTVVGASAWLAVVGLAVWPPRRWGRRGPELLQ